MKPIGWVSVDNSMKTEMERSNSNRNVTQMNFMCVEFVFKC